MLVEQLLINEIFQPDSDSFGPITLYSWSDWITTHPEAPQDFWIVFQWSLQKDTLPEKCNIYIQCIGSLLLLLLSRFSRARLCATPETAPPGSPVPEILQARTLEWVAISFSNAWKWSRAVVSDSSRPHGLQPTRLLRPWDFPGKSTGVGCHCLLRLDL